jgi:DNA-binding NtrC family response regulator
VARGLALNPSGVILPEDLPEPLRQGSQERAASSGVPALAPGTERLTLAELERRYAAVVLEETGGNKTRAAEILGIDRKTLYRLIGEKDEK